MAKQLASVTVNARAVPARLVRKTAQIRLGSGDYITLHLTPTESSIVGGVPEWETFDRPGKKPIIRVGARSLRELSFSHHIIGRHGSAIGSQVNKITDLVRQGQMVRLRHIDPTIESDIWWVVTGYDIKVLKRREDQQVTAVELSWKFTELSDEKSSLKKIVPKPKPKLKLGAAKPKGGKWYTVKKGDCLWNIAKKHYKDPLRWKEIWRHNKKRSRSKTNPHLIFPGERFWLP